MGRPKLWRCILFATALGWVLAAFAGPVLGESSPRGIREARQAAEREARKRPRSVDAQVRLAEAYYTSARDAFDRRGDEPRYLLYLERSVDACVRAARIDPGDYRPHFYLALIDVYRGDLKGALRGFCRVEEFAPGGFSKTNIAETYLYLGELETARAWNRRGLAEAGPGPVAFNDMLIEWKEGDLAGARAHFGRLRAKYPELLETINAARVPVPARTFEEFTKYCCGSPACGPYLEEACSGAGFEVEKRQISERGQREELRIEAKKVRELEGLYESRDELDFCLGRDPGQ